MTWIKKDGCSKTQGYFGNFSHLAKGLVWKEITHFFRKVNSELNGPQGNEMESLDTDKGGNEFLFLTFLFFGVNITPL